MRAPSKRVASPARLCAFNAGIQLVWGAILAVSLQERSIALAPGGGVGAYAAIAAAGALVATIVQLVAGRESDRIRARGGSRMAFYACGIATAIPALGWFYLAPTYAQLVCAFLMLEVAMNVAGGPYQAIIPDHVAAERRGLASSWMAGYQSIGNAAGLLVAGFVHDLRLVAALLAAGLLSTGATSALHVRRLPALARGRVREPRGQLRVLLLSRGLINLGFFTLLGFLLFFVRDSLGVTGAATTTGTALLFLTFTLGAVPGAAVAAQPADRADKRAVVSYAVGAMAIALAFLAGATSLAVAFVAAGLAGAAWGAFVTADWALATALLPGGSMATAMGVWNVATTLPQVAAPLLAAPLIAALARHATGLGPRGAIVLALVECAAGAAVVWRLPRV